MAENKYATPNAPSLRAVTTQDVQREEYLLDKVALGLDLVSGKEKLGVTNLTKQIDKLSYLFWRGAPDYLIGGRKDADLSRACAILCVLHENSAKVTEELLEDTLIPRVLFRQGRRTDLSVRELMAFRREVVAFSKRVKACFSKGKLKSNVSDAELKATGLYEIRRAKQMLLSE